MTKIHFIFSNEIDGIIIIVFSNTKHFLSRSDFSMSLLYMQLQTKLVVNFRTGVLVKAANI